MIKLFLSHAFEDKNDFVQPLATALKPDFEVWVDQAVITLGDSLLGKVNWGLHECDYGVVVLSYHFFAKHWTRAELDGLFSLETAERKVILPVWKDVTLDDVRKFSPILAGRLGVSTDRGIEGVVYEIKRAVGLVDRVRELHSEPWNEKFATLNADLKHERAAKALAQSSDGVQQATKAARDVIAEARVRTELLSKQVDAFEIKVNPATNLDGICVSTPQLSMVISFNVVWPSSIDGSKINVRFFRHLEITEEYDILPMFDRQLQVCWQRSHGDPITGSALLDEIFEHFAELLQRWAQ